jgi:predicted DNA binding CopG/RHH family protein
MKKEYDFSKAVKNPYIKKLKKSVTIRLDDDVVFYFKSLANEKGVPYQSLINLYLKDCVANHREPSLTWS